MRARFPALIISTLLLVQAASPALADDSYLHSFFRTLGDDYQTQVKYPFNLAKDEPAAFLAGVGGIALLIGTDPTTEDWLAPDPVEGSRRLERAQSYSNLLLPVTVVTVAAFGIVGISADRQKEKDTTEFLARALITANTWTGILKILTGRQRPRETTGDHSDWTGPGGIFAEPGDTGHYYSFPSGHSTTAWALATVVSHQYPSHHVVPIVVYTGAAAMSLSRMIVEAHWMSDVVVGGLIGYGCANQVTRSGAAGGHRGSGGGSVASVSVARGWQMQLDMHEGYRGVALVTRW